MNRITISSNQLSMMRATIPLPDTCIIYSITENRDSAGRDSGGSAVAVTGGTVSCRIDPINSSGNQASVIGGQETLKTQYQLTLPYDAPIAEGYQVVTGGRTYEIRELNEVHSMNVSRRAGLVEVR